jgi:DNA-binding phage protein
MDAEYLTNASGEMKSEKIIEARKMLCRYLAELARERGISTYKIAEITGFNQPNVHRMLSGKYPPSLDNFLILADAIGSYIFIIDKDHPDSDLVTMMKQRWKHPHQEQ